MAGSSLKGWESQPELQASLMQANRAFRKPPAHMRACSKVLQSLDACSKPTAIPPYKNSCSCRSVCCACSKIDAIAVHYYACNLGWLKGYLNEARSRQGSARGMHSCHTCLPTML